MTEAATPAPRRRRPLFGVFARQMVKAYGWHVAIVFASVLGVVTALDVSSTIVRVWSEAAAGGLVAGVSRSAQFVFYRLLDNGSQSFPVTFVLGIVWAEISLTRSGQRVMARTAGLSLLRGSAGLLVAAGLSVPVQFVFDNVLRPYAFMSLSIKGLGEYGWRYQRQRAERVEWLAFSGNIVQVRMRDDPAPRLDQLTSYRFSPDGELVRITDAQTVEPTSSSILELAPARQWAFTADSGERAPVGYTALDRVQLETAIDPLWLEYRFIAPKYIPLLDLASLATATGTPDNAPDYAGGLQIRLAQAVNPALVSICMVWIFYLLLDALGLVAASVAMLLAGYLGFTLTRVAAVVAQHEVLPAAFAIWSPPLAFLALGIALFLRLRAGDRRYAEPGEPT